MSREAQESMADLLRRIVEQRRRRLGKTAMPAADSGPEVEPLAPEHPFLAALAARRGGAIIAEVKMGSPRLGFLGDRVDPRRQSVAYRRGGAAALSVVVEPDFFHGSYELLSDCRRASGLPVIAKDFLVSVRQLDMARQAGADAVLLIAALYERSQLLAWAQRARRLGLVPLVETHDRSDLEKLAGREWELVGVNNRDLRSFEVDLQHSVDRVAELPAASLKVAESGIASRRDVEKLAAAGFDAFLVGESLLLAPDPEAKLRELLE